MSGDDDKDRLRRLEARIAAAKSKPAAETSGGAHYDQAGLAWRMVTELVAGLGIGLAIGLGLDTLFGTAPVLMVLFTGLGFAAGIKVMLRTAAEMTAGPGSGDAATETPAAPRAGDATETEDPGSAQAAPRDDGTKKG